MSTATVQGLAVGLLMADDTLAALVPTGHIYAGEMVAEMPLPYIVVHDVQEDPVWITTTARFEVHHLSANVYAKALGSPGQDNLAEQIADRVEALWDWDDLALPRTTPIRFVQTRRILSLSSRRAPDKERVTQVSMSWDLEFERELA